METIKFKFALFLSLAGLISADAAGFKPVVLWHGMGDACCNPWSLGKVKEWLQASMPGVYVLSLRIGSNAVQDTESGFFGNVNNQIAKVCQQLVNDPQLANGYNAIGFSQGGQFLRGVAQRCPGKMENLISIGGQHQGVYGLPRCLGEAHTLCDYARRLLNYGAYKSWIQSISVQAQYWHDPVHEDEYREKSLFLADINNEEEINEKYVENLQKLNKLVLVMFANDTIVDPKESSWFGFFKPGQGEVLETLQESRIYKEDRLGLKAMMENDKIDFIAKDGNHLNISPDFMDEIVDKYFK